MTLTKIATVTLLAFAASTAQAQNVTTSSGDIVMIEKHQVVVSTVVTTGFTPLTGLTLVSGPLVLGLGTIIVIGAISSSSGSGTN